MTAFRRRAHRGRLATRASFPPSHALIAASGAAFTAVVLGQARQRLRLPQRLFPRGGSAGSSNRLLLGRVLAELGMLAVFLFLAAAGRPAGPRPAVARRPGRGARRHSRRAARRLALQDRPPPPGRYGRPGHQGPKTLTPDGPPPQDGSMTDSPVLWFEEIGMGDVPQVGGKNASLGELIQSLKAKGVRVPDGFATTADAYRRFLEANGIEAAMRSRIKAYRSGETSLRATGEAIRELFLDSEFPADIGESDPLPLPGTGGARRTGDRLSVAVRSSATAEDLPDASFAGQQETFLNIAGERELLDACRRCYASLFTDRAISYREVKGFDHLDVALSIGVQRMVRSDVGASGVMFSIDTDSGFPRVGRGQRRLGPGRNRGPGHHQSGQVPCVQAAPGAAGVRADHRKDPRCQGPEDGLQPGRARPHQNGGHHGCRTPRLCPGRRRDPRPGALGRERRGALRPADGHGMGPRRRDRRAVYGPGPAGDGPVAEDRLAVHPPPPAGNRHRTGTRGSDRRFHRPGHRVRDQERGGHRKLPRRRHPRHRDDRPGLGAHHEAGSRHRHRPRRTHEPRGDREPRTRGSRRRRHRQRHHRPGGRPRRDHLVRRGR